MSIFSKSPLEKHVLAITDENLRDSDIAGNMELADTINRSDDDGKEALKLIFKRIKHKNPVVQLYALQLLDLCVKNCHTAFHQHLATKDNLKFLSELGTEKKTNPNVRDLTLTLLESWNEAFTRQHEFQLPIFGEYYQKLKRKGVEFPARDMAAMAPVLTPHVNQNATPQRRMSAGPSNDANLAYQQQLQQQYGSPGARMPVYPPMQAGPGSAPYQPSPLSPPGYMPPPQYQVQDPHQYPLAQPIYPGQPPMMYQPYPNQQLPPQPYQHPQAPPPQQPPMTQREKDAAKAASRRAKLTPQQLKQYEQFTYLSADYINKVKDETNLTFDYMKLLKDIASAADSPQALQADPLASNLQRVLVEVRNRYTKLILELGDIISPASAAAAEFLIDLAIRMIDAIRIILDYHKARCEGVAVAPPEVPMPKGLSSDVPQTRKSPEGSSSSSSVKSSPQPISNAAGAGSIAPQPYQPPSQPVEMNLFDMPAPPANDDDEKQVVANVFASHRPKNGSVSSPGPAPAQASPAKAVVSPPPVAGGSFLDSFFPPQQQQSQSSPQQSPPVDARKRGPSLVPNPTPLPQVAAPTPFDDEGSRPSNSSVDVFDQLAPMREGGAAAAVLRKSSVTRTPTQGASSSSSANHGPMSPGGPPGEPSQPPPAAIPEVASVADSFLDDMMAFTVPQPATETKEGEQ